MNSWQRLELVIRWTNMTVHSFAIHIGLKRSENLYQIKKGNNGISRKLALQIVAIFPQIDSNWLLTGEGTMLLADSGIRHIAHEKSHKIPYYGVDMSTVRIGIDSPDYYIDAPAFYGADFATKVNSSSMMPNIPPGAIVALKKIDKNFIVFGELYLIVTKNFTVIRDLRAETDDSVKLIPINSKDFDEVVITLDSIKSLYIVKGVMYEF